MVKKVKVVLGKGPKPKDPKPEKRPHEKKGGGEKISRGWQDRQEDKEGNKDKNVKKKKPIKVWKRKSVFWELECWKFLDGRHCIDVMHIDKKNLW